MLLPDNIHPENTVYFNGALILRKLYTNNKIKLLDLYQLVKSERQISFPLFILSLDWLYLLSAAELNNKGEIELCS